MAISIPTNINAFAHPRVSWCFMLHALWDTNLDAAVELSNDTPSSLPIMVAQKLWNTTCLKSWCKCNGNECHQSTLKHGASNQPFWRNKRLKPPNISANLPQLHNSLSDCGVSMHHPSDHKKGFNVYQPTSGWDMKGIGWGKPIPRFHCQCQPVESVFWGIGNDVPIPLGRRTNWIMDVPI